MNERMHTVYLEISHRSYGVDVDRNIVLRDDMQTHGTTLLVGVSIDPEADMESVHRSVALALERAFKTNERVPVILQLG